MSKIFPPPVIAPTPVPKLWGETRRVRLGDTEFWHASIRAGGFSSQHRHMEHTNDFYVVKGVVRICHYHVYGEPYSYQTVTLKAGQHFSVNPGVWHRFEAVTDVELIENYWNPQGTRDHADIERFDQGGCNEPTCPA